MTLPSRRTLLILAGALLLVVVGGAAGSLWYVSRERAAAAAYAEALTTVQLSRTNAGSPDAAAAAARQLEATLQQYPSSRLAPDAAYELGNLRYAERQYPAARSAYEVALAKGAAPTIRTLSRAGVAYTWEAEKDFARAADAFQAAMTGAGPADFLYEELALDLARTQELAGRREQAIETYRRVLKDLPKARRTDEIRGRLASLGASY
jgi:tetratricopeptide (TPR) repeat protein